MLKKRVKKVIGIHSDKTDIEQLFFNGEKMEKTDAKTNYFQ